MYLNCHTALSFKYGVLQPAALLREVRRCGVTKFVLTEINNTASWVEVKRLLEEEHKQNPTAEPIQMAAGIEFRNEDRLLYTGIAEDDSGFESLNRYLSVLRLNQKPLPDHAPDLDYVFFVYPYGKINAEILRENEFIGVTAGNLSRFRLDGAGKEYPEKFVIWQPVTFTGNNDFQIHRLLRAIHHNTLLSKLRNEDCATPDEIMIPVAELKAKFSDFPELILTTESLLKRCSLTIPLGTPKNKATLSGSPEQDWEYLVEESRKGFVKKYGAGSDALEERFNRELNIIREKNFCAYYLIALDLIRFAESKGFDHIGRGSGANSMIAWCLGITNVDPVELDLYFERFLNPERSSPPDFDIDFSWDQRDRMYDYLFARYGSAHVCLLGTHTTLQERSVIRELGKVFGLPKNEIDQLADDPDSLKNRDELTRVICNYAEYMKDLPVNLSIHAGGVLITEKPVYAYTATDLPPKDYPVAHLEMHNAEDAGIYKFDILSQRGLGHIRETIRLIRLNRNIEVDINRFTDFKSDPLVRTMLREGRTIGCFYIESPAMRMLLRKLDCDNYLTLVAASSIIRPGVARSGMMRAYIERFHLHRQGKDYVSAHPVLKELLSETYGVMVYQEDVIRVAHYFAGLSLAEADVLRRGMSGKFRSRREFEKIKEKFFSNCKERGYETEVTDRIWYEIESFSGYSFAKGHSASYAVESYQSLYLKAHHPIEFMTGVINNFGGFYKTEFYFHEARMSGATIEAPCVNKADFLTSVSGTTIYTGFIHLRSLEGKWAKLIPEERLKNGAFTGLYNFMNRIPVGLEQIRILIRCGAFRFTGKTKQQLMWEAVAGFGEARQSRSKSTGSLFNNEVEDLRLPRLEHNTLEDLYDEIELFGFTLGDPFRLLKEPVLPSRADDMKRQTGKSFSITGYLVTTKMTYTAGKKIMNFGTFLDASGEMFDTVHFPEASSKFPFRGRGFYNLSGKITEEFGVFTLGISRMDKLSHASLGLN
jgi:DNA polymerase-3 subunit alpha